MEKLVEKLEAFKKAHKVLSQEQLRNITGGFACYCNGSYKGEYSSVESCYHAC